MKTMNFVKSIIFLYLLVIISCSPSLGASWYAKSSSSSAGADMWVTSIKVMNQDVKINDPNLQIGENDKDVDLVFAKAKRFSISLPYSCDVLDVDSLKIVAYEDSKKQKPLKVSLDIEGDNVHLVPGEAVAMLLRIKDDKGRFKVEEKFISITREMPENADLVLESVEVLGQLADMDEEGKAGSVKLPYSAGEKLFDGCVRAKFKVGDASKYLPVVITEGSNVVLAEGDVAELECSVEEKEMEYNAYSFNVTCTRLAKTDDEDEPLKLAKLSILSLDAMAGEVMLPSNVNEIRAGDIEAEFEEHGKLEVKLQEDMVRLNDVGATELVITVPAKKGVYAKWSKAVQAIKQVDLLLESVKVLGKPVNMDSDGKNGSVELPYSKGDQLFNGSISAKFKVGNESKSLHVLIDGGEVELVEGATRNVSCLVEEKKKGI